MKINTDKLSGNTEGCKKSSFLASIDFSQKFFKIKIFKEK